MEKSEYKSIFLKMLTKKQLQRICKLYKLLYLDMHTKLNPNYTQQYFSWHLNDKNHRFLFLVKEREKILMLSFVFEL